MSVNVRIQQKSLFRRKLGIEDIIKISKLSYGICDENYRLEPNQIGDHTLLYDNQKLARGIDVTLEKQDILLQLSLPTSLEEIQCFYDLIQKICKKINTSTFIRDEEIVSITEKELCIRYDAEASIKGLQGNEQEIKEGKFRYFQIFGIYNPISIGKKEIEEINCDLNKFCSFLNRIQAIDAYYAAPRVYKIGEKLVGIYAIGPSIPSIVPTEPYIILNQIEGIEEWYFLSNEKTVPYHDFINHVNKEYYDANHVIVNLKVDEIEELIEKYSIEL